MRLVVGIVVAALVAGTAYAQRGFRFRNAPIRLDTPPNIPYDGRFTFVRIKYRDRTRRLLVSRTPLLGSRLSESEWNLMKIMDEVSDLDAHIEETNVLTFDDPDLFKYPIAYFIEAGWWTLTQAEAAGLRKYLDKGGFVILDDFKVEGQYGYGGGGFAHFEELCSA